MFYSKTTGGFYHHDINEEMPIDIINVTNDDYQTLIDGQQHGKTITANENGYPILVDPEEPDDYQLAAEARAKRNTLIEETDYLLLPDYPVNEERMMKIKSYRQELRDITEQLGFPEDITWPTMPT